MDTERATFKGHPLIESIVGLSSPSYLDFAACLTNPAFSLGVMRPLCDCIICRVGHTTYVLAVLHEALLYTL